MAKAKRINEQTKSKPLSRFRNGFWPPEARYDRWRVLWCILLLVLSVAGFEAISIYWTTRRFTGLLAVFMNYPMVILLNVLPLLLLTALLYALTGRVCLSAGVPGIVLLVLTLVNSFKLNLRGDPFVFSDILLAGEAGDMLTSSYSLVFSKSQIAGIIIAIVWMIFLSRFSGKIRIRGHRVLRGCVAGGSAIALALLMFLVYPSDSLYKSTYAGGELVSSRDAAQWYAAHGFTWSFLHSAIGEDDVAGLFYSMGYDEELLDLFADSEEVELSEVPNIIAIQLEAYCDVTDYIDSEAVEEVYASLHALEDEGISGNLLVNVNGGGTQDTERSFITGYTSLPDFNTETNSYAWYLSSLGYIVEGSHPSTGTFYDRVTINANLGFDAYYFSENLYGDLVDENTAALDSDAVLFEEIVDLMLDALDSEDEESEDEESRYFSFNISLQNHGPYSTAAAETEYLTEADCANETVRNIVNNYLDLIASTNEALSEMVDTLRDLDEPVMLVIFGDHLPYWGNYTTLDPYEELGLNFDTSTDEGYYNYYSTPYLIWANDAAKQLLGDSLTGDGGDFGPYFLMNLIFELCGIPGDQMTQASNDLLDAGITMVSSAVEVYCENGELVDTLSEAGQEALDTFLEFQSAWQSTFQYEEDEEALEEAEESAEESGTEG